MKPVENLSAEIKSIGFRCTRCGTCCRCVDKDSNLVMVFPHEVRNIISATGLEWNQIAEPYPGQIDDGRGGIYTLGWSLLHEGDKCRFLNKGVCAIYEQRPWICRTYPFMLDENELVISSCEGLGSAMSDKEAGQIAHALLQRQCAEREEEQQVRQVLRHHHIPAGKPVVIDSERVRVIHG
jgi:Fe-S-cluster containining protein